jgi:hypothetical protein
LTSHTFSRNISRHEKRNNIKMKNNTEYLYELESAELCSVKYSEEMAIRSYEEGIGIELFDTYETPDEVFEPEYLGDR